jgi:assimilatory nitrate reductase catalytic subunit
VNETRTTCPYCGVGCGVIVEHDDRHVTGVRGDPDHPANRGRLCSKGQALHLSATPAITLHRRLHAPRLDGREVGWDEALDHAAERIAATVRSHGPEAVGFYLSGQLLTEDYAVFNKLAKGLIGTPHLDTNSRLCMSSAVAGYKATLGADAPPACYDDIAHAHCLFVAGSNAAWAHPVLWRRVEDARRANPALKLIVVDPRRTETAAQADLHLALLPGTDVALFHGMLNVMLWEGLVDTAYIARHTRGFDALRDRVRETTPREAARITGLAEADIVQAARWFATSPATLSLYCQGLNQSANGTAKNAALVHLHLATGHIGRPGAGPFSLTGQPNAMGGREVGGLANLLPGHREAADPAHRAEVARLWGVDAVAAGRGKTAVELFQAAADGEIQVLWIACTNPAQSLPDQATVRRALERCPFVVLHEAFAGTATAAYAHLLLPAASWAEKDGTVTNSERRISRVRQAVPPPGQARADWAIAADVARRLEHRLRPGRPSVFDYADAEAVWNEHRACTQGRDLDITGLDWAHLDAAGPQQWPFPSGAATGQARLYTDGVFATPDGKARFADLPYVPVAEPRDARHPFALNTGRLRDQWHGASRTGLVPRLFGHASEPVVELHPQDMARLRLAEGDLVEVASRRGAVVLPASASSSVAPAHAFVAMHWGEEFVAGGTAAHGVNTLTSPALCPRSAQPELKHAAVRITPAALPWRLVALRWCDDEAQALDLQPALRARFADFGYASCVPFGRDRHGLLFRAALAAAPAPAVVDRIAALFGLADADTLHYSDARRGQRRSLRARRDAEGALRLDAVLLAGDTGAEARLASLLQQETPLQPATLGRLLLPRGADAAAALPRPRQVCTCLGVDEARIASVLAATAGTAGERLATLQARLRCGTQCGACLPELQRLAATPPVTTTQPSTASGPAPAAAQADAPAPAATATAAEPAATAP